MVLSMYVILQLDNHYLTAKSFKFRAGSLKEDGEIEIYGKQEIRRRPCWLFKPGENEDEGHNYSIRQPDVIACSVCPNDV